MELELPASAAFLFLSFTHTHTHTHRLPLLGDETKYASDMDGSRSKVNCSWVETTLWPYRQYVKTRGERVVKECEEH